jgi:hypothetical protein
MEVRVFTKGVLKRANARADELGYNRVTQAAFLDALPEGFYTPKYVLPHEHKAGQPCERHVRCVFDHNDNYFFIDVEMAIWEKLPTESSFAAMVNHVHSRRAAGDTSV